MFRYLLFGSLVLTLVAGEELLKSPCPGIFDYEKTDEAGQWAGTLTLKSEFSLHGVWIRVFFDRPVKTILSADSLVDIHPTDNDAKNFLLKNRDFLLKKNEPVKVKFTVTYEGDEKPALTGYRLNARNVCPQDQD